MTNVVTKAALTPARKRLVELRQEINYGRIEGLRVQDSEPVFDPPLTVLRLFLFGKENGPNDSRGNDGFALKKKVAALFKAYRHELEADRESTALNVAKTNKAAFLDHYQIDFRNETTVEGALARDLFVAIKRLSNDLDLFSA